MIELFFISGLSVVFVVFQYLKLTNYLSTKQRYKLLKTIKPYLQDEGYSDNFKYFLDVMFDECIKGNLLIRVIFSLDTLKDNRSNGEKLELIRDFMGDDEFKVARTIILDFFIVNFYANIFSYTVIAIFGLIFFFVLSLVAFTFKNISKLNNAIVRLIELPSYYFVNEVATNRHKDKA